MSETCNRCGAPNHKTVLRQYGWWTEVTLPASVWATNGRLTYEPGTRQEKDGAVIETIPGRQFISLPWKSASETSGAIQHLSCFPNTGQHRFVYIVLGVFKSERLCQWCRFHSDPRFKRLHASGARP